jgi:hypothetical protein
MTEKADRSRRCSPSRRARIAAPLLLAALALPSFARADATPQDQAIAQSLYDEGRSLMTAKKFAQACPKLEESQRLDPAPATQFHLADCYERTGRTASAWAAFLEVASTSKVAGRTEREKVARERADALAPKLTKLTISVSPGTQVSGLVVRRNGTLVREGQWGAAISVDPGPQAIEASAPGKVTWQSQVDASGEGKTTSIDVPALVDAPMAAVTAPPAAAPAPAVLPAMPGAEPADTRRGNTQRIIAVVVAGVGVVGVALGSYAGVSALGKNSDSNAGHCSGNTCDAMGVSLRKDAVSAGNRSTVAFIAGGVAIAGGAVLWFTAPSSHLQVGPAVGAGAYGAALRGAF